MVTSGGTRQTGDGHAESGELVLRIDGQLPPSPEMVARIAAVCDRAEDLGGAGRVIVYASGAPANGWTSGLTVAAVSKWERGLRRLERVAAITIAVADGDCGGPALDALLVTDYRVMAASARFLIPVEDRATWPGMALYRLARQGAHAAAIRRAVLFGTPIRAAEAMTLGLVDQVTDDVFGALAAASALTAGLSGTELAIRRQLTADAPIVSFEDALGAHLAACDRALRHAADADTAR